MQRINGLIQPRTRPFALVTGGTGRTGQKVAGLLLEQGYDIRFFVRDIDKAKDTLRDVVKDSTSVIEYCQGELCDPQSIEEAFDCKKAKPLTHVIYCAGGDTADYTIVSYKGVSDCARLAAEEAGGSQVKNFVFISTAWATKPYSIASLLFNSMYNNTIPMACHLMGEEEIRKYAAVGNGFSYVIVRPGGLNTDENYIKKFGLEAFEMGLTYSQGDNFEFLGIAGRPGMSRTQLANVVVTAATAISLGDAGNAGKYTVEVTGSGNVELQDTSVYSRLVQDQGGSSVSNDEIMEIHSNAVSEMKTTAIGVSVISVILVATLGWMKGIVSGIALDALILLIWSIFYATYQISGKKKGMMMLEKRK